MQKDYEPIQVNLIMATLLIEILNNDIETILAYFRKLDCRLILHDFIVLLFSFKYIFKRICLSLHESNVSYPVCQ